MISSGLIRLLLVMFILVCISGCSYSDNSISTGVPDQESTGQTESSSRQLFGVWELSADLNNGKIAFSPIRSTDNHYNITSMIIPPACTDCIIGEITFYDPTPNIIFADITLRNPTGLAGYDVRGIIHTKSTGNRLTNADGWTSLYDWPGGQDINPFKAFASTEPNRAFGPYAEYTTEFIFHIPDSDSIFSTTFAVDASFPGNCEEPYAITNFTQEPIGYFKGISGSVNVDVVDWQDDISEVYLNAPGITGNVDYPFTLKVNNTYELQLPNELGAAPGVYQGLITAKSFNSGDLSLYKFVEIAITQLEPEFNPKNLVPGGISGLGKTVDMDVYDDVLYVVNGKGLNRLDISDPESIYIIESLPLPSGPAVDNWSGRVDFLDGFLYFASVYPYNVCTSVYNACPSVPFHLSEENCNDSPTGLYDMVVGDGYMFVTSGGPMFHIIDIDPISEMHLAKSLDLWQYTGFIAYSNEIAYVDTKGYDIWMIPVIPPEDAGAAKKIDVPGKNPRLVIQNSNLYTIARDPENLAVYDITNQWNPELKASVPVSDFPLFDLEVSGGYAFAITWGWDSEGTLYIFDVDPPEDAHIVTEFPVFELAVDLVVYKNYTYIANSVGNIEIIQLW